MFNSQSHVTLPSTRRRARDPLFASTMLLAVGIALAAPGDLDPSFSDDGLLSLRVGNSESGAVAAVQQADGNLVLAGWGDLGFMVARVGEDGTPDSTFGTDGVAFADFAGVCCQYASALAQQMDGKLVLAGAVGASENIALVRFNADGTLDASFGTGGKVTLDIAGSHDAATGLILQPSGKLVVAGRSISGGDYRFVFARFNTDGRLDTTFGTGGTTLVDFGGESRSMAADIGQRSDGKLVAVGQVVALTPAGGFLSSDIGIVRVTANGMLDSTFDGDGLLTVDFNGDNEEAGTLAIQPDDAIVVVGSTWRAGGTSSSTLLLRLNGDGSLDNSFSVGVLPDTNLNSIVVQADGKLVATGSRSRGASGDDMILARFKSDGVLDTTYGIDGVATADFGERDIAPNSWGADVIQQANGKYVAVGTSGSNAYSFGAARFDDNAAFPGRIGLTATNRLVLETTSTVTYTVRRTGGRTGVVSVNYATAAGQAQPVSDFEDASGTLTWNHGDAGDKTLSINLINDAVNEEDEDFSLILSAPTGGAQLAASEATTIIASEDGPGRLEFSFALDEVQVHEDFFFGEPIGGGTSVPVRRTAGSTGAVSVSYSTTDGTATAGTDFVATSGTLNWADGDTDVKLVRIVTRPDSVSEGDEDFQIRLSDPTGGATIDPLTSVQLVRILDNDSGLGFGIGFASIEATVGEAGGSVVLNVSRSGAAVGAVSVNYSTSSGSAIAGSDFTSANGTLDWADGDTAAKTITVNITNDNAVEGDETFTVTLSNPTGGLPLGSNFRAAVNIIDDDSPSPSGNSGGGSLGFLSVLLLAFARLVRSASMTARSRSVPTAG